MDFRAAVLTAIDAPLAIERVALDTMAPGDVLIRANSRPATCWTSNSRR